MGVVFSAFYRLPGLHRPEGRSLISLKDGVPGGNQSSRSLAVCKKKLNKQ